MVSLIGCGKWGKNYLKSFNKLKITPKFICDIDSGKKEIVLEQFKKTKFLTDFKKIKDNKIIIATSNNTHSEIIKYFLKQNKDLLIEKPIVTLKTDLIKIKKEYDQIKNKNNAFILTDHIFRFVNAIQELNNYIHEITEPPEYVKFEWYDNILPKNNNIILDLGIHPFDIIDYIFHTLEISLASKLIKHHLELSNHQETAILIFKLKKTIYEINLAWNYAVKTRKIAVSYTNYHNNVVVDLVKNESTQFTILPDNPTPLEKVILTFINKQQNRIQLPKLDTGIRILNFMFYVMKKNR